MIPIGEGKHYLTIKKVICITEGITSQHQSGFYSLNCLHSFASNFNFVKKCMKKFFLCDIVLLSEGTKILEFNP